MLHRWLLALESRGLLRLGVFGVAAGGRLGSGCSRSKAIDAIHVGRALVLIPIKGALILEVVALSSLQTGPEAPADQIELLSVRLAGFLDREVELARFLYDRWRAENCSVDSSARHVPI